MSNMQNSKSPINDLRNDKTSFLQSSPFKQTQINFQSPKIDHAFILQSYRKLRLQQRDQIAKLRMPDNLKRKIFNFKEDDNIKYQKPELVIFNHPFRGKMVMTKKEVQAQLQRERRNAQTAEQKQYKNQKVSQNLLNSMGVQDEQIKVRKVKLERQQSSQSEQKYPQKQRATSNKKQTKIAEDINRKQAQTNKDNMFFIHKPTPKYENPKQNSKNVRNKTYEDQNKQTKNSFKTSGSKFNQYQKERQSKSKFKNMPKIEQQPKVIRDIKINTQESYKKRKSQDRVKNGNNSPIKDFKIQKLGYKSSSGDNLLKKNIYENENSFDPNQNRSLSKISAISQNQKNESLSNSSSLNKALFLE